MRTRSAFLSVAALFAAFTLAPSLQAQPLVNIETVTVGDAGNVANDAGAQPGRFGAVDYEFNIGKYEVTVSQYTTFLNSVASVTSDSYIVDLWNASMTSDLNSAGISRTGAGTIADPYVYAETGPFGLTPSGASSAGNRPISYVSWFDAARFANWLHNGAIDGASTETGAYTLNGASSGDRVTKNAGATWWIPSENEWYKAAYYKGGGTNAGYWLYPTQSNVLPGNTIGSATNQANYNSGVYSVTQSVFSSSQNYLTDVGAFSNSASAYGTFDQGGNVAEYNDSLMPWDGGLRGGAWYGTEYGGNMDSETRFDSLTTDEDDFVGFRVASAVEVAIPEPSTYALLLMTGAGALWWARRRRQ